MRYKFWSQKEMRLLKRLYPTTRVKDLIELFPTRTKATIVAKARSLNLPSAKLWQPSEDTILRKYFYKAKKKKLLALLPRRSWGAILARGERVGLKRRLNKPTLRVDENYFKKWSSNMAYILGFILADGCIVKSKRKGYSDSLKFGVHFRDADILKKIKRELKSEHKISEVGNALHFSIASQIIVNDLKDLGVTYRKSLNENIPKVPKVFMRDFIRGIIDGDGSIKIDRTGYPNLAIYGGREIMKFIRDHFLEKFDIYSKLLKGARGRKGKCLYQIAYRCNSAQKLLGYLYKDSNLFLDRKFKLVEKCLVIDIGFKKNYTERELKIIRGCYSLRSKEELLKFLPKRKWKNIQAKAWELGMFKYQRRRNATADS
jgi:hypothetical protein